MEKGKLLIHNKYPFSSTFKWFDFFGFFICILAFLVLIFIFGLGDFDFKFLAIFFILCFILVLLYVIIEEMPLEVYEGGIAHPFPGLRYALRRQELFIPWDNIKSVDFKRGNSEMDWYILVFKLHRGPDFKYRHGDISYPTKFLMILKEKIPEKLDEKMIQYISELD